ncbi:hypothetical protein GGI18_004852, partial [Coemansia linderi]
REKTGVNAGFETIADVEKYGERAYACLIHPHLEALGVRDMHADNAARAIGVASAIMNFSRSLPLLLPQKRCDLPRDLVEKHKIDLDALYADPRPKPELCEAIYEFSTKGYTRLCGVAEIYVPNSPKQGFPALLAAVPVKECGNNAGWALTESSMDLVRRTALASQICYFLVHIMLAIHVMSVAGVLNPKFDRSIGGYYGPAAGALSFVITHRVLAAAPLYSAFYYTLLPTATLAAVFAAALLVPNADCAKDARITVFIGEDEDVEATVSLGDYSVFSKIVAAMCLVWHLPWLLWYHTPKPAGWALMLAFVPLCARGIHSFVLLRMSPATGVQVLDDDDDGSSNGGNNDKHSH